MAWQANYQSTLAGSMMLVGSPASSASMRISRQLYVSRAPQSMHAT